MAFNFNFKRQPDLTNYVGAPIDPYNASRIASENMEGYTPNAAFTPGTPAEQAAAAMQGYTQNPQGGQFSVPNDMHGGNAQPDLEGYGEGLQAASDAAGQAQKIEQQKDNLKSKISALETSIAEKKSKLQNWTGNANQIAAIEARKINSQDPTMVWRWKMGQDAAKQQRADDLKRIEAEKAKTKEEQKQFIRNKISATLPTMSIGWKTSPEQIQQYKNTLAGLKTEAMNSNLSDQFNNILEAEAQLNGQLPQQKAQMAMDAMANAANMFNVTKDEGGFGKDSKAYHDYLLQQYTKITKEFPEAKYDPEFNKAFSDADKLYRKTVKTKKVRPSGRS